MRQIFVFTAGKKDARKHLKDSITSPAPFTLLDGLHLDHGAEYFKALMPGQTGFYAWGAVEGDRNVPTWKSMQVGDLVLTVFDNRYHYFSSVVAKLRSRELATRIWGVDKKNNTWEYMYFLSQPQPVSAKVNGAPLNELLNNGYRGFCRILPKKTQKVVEKYGSLDTFFEQELNVSIPSTSIQRELAALQNEADQEDQFDPKSGIDGRQKILRSVVYRQGQLSFRKSLLDAYDGRCVVTGCRIEAVLQAAHIKAYDGENSNAIQNGLLLRADIHTLFDLGHLKVHETGVIQLHESLLQSDYKGLHGRKIRLPKDPKHAPNTTALSMKFGMVL